MTKISAIYLGELRMESVHELSGTHLITDAPVDNQGKGSSFSPTDLLATSLGTCMVTTMGIVANRNNIALDGTKVAILKIMESNPRRVGKVVVEITVPPLHLDNETKLKLEHAAHACPVAKSLHPDLIQEVKFRWEA